MSPMEPGSGVKPPPPPPPPLVPVRSFPLVVPKLKMADEIVVLLVTPVAANVKVAV